MGDVATYRAETALPYEHTQRATAGLRAELRHQVLSEGPGVLPDWSTLEVTVPVELDGPSGRTWYRWWPPSKRGASTGPRRTEGLLWC
jgi:hypothetical protein